MVSTPSPPDPYATAAAQTASNEQTANYQSSLNQTNQITPYGSIDYNQTGTSSSGAPQYTATTTLSPQVENLVNSNLSNNQAESGLEGQLANNASATLSHPLDLSPGALQSQLNQQAEVSMDPQWARLGDQNEAQLYNRGLAPGSQGYDAGMTDFSNQRQQAYSSTFGQNEQLAQNTLEQQYEAPLNALNALKSGSQISQPGVGQTASTTPTSVAGTNIAGLIQQNYQSQLAQSNATMGGLFGLGGSLISGAAMFSDRRLKKDIAFVGTRSDGLRLYTWKYIWSGPTRLGPMADEVRELYPDAVFDVGGYLAIDLGRLPSPA